MSGIDEQPQVELKCRVFFKMGDLLETLKEGDFVEGDVFYLDEGLNTREYKEAIEHVKKFARAKKVMVARSFLVLENVINLVKRIGVKKFKESWF